MISIIVFAKAGLKGPPEESNLLGALALVAIMLFLMAWEVVRFVRDLEPPTIEAREEDVRQAAREWLQKRRGEVPARKEENV